VNPVLANECTQYVLQIAGLVLCLYLFVSLKREIWAAETKAREARQALETGLAELHSVVDEIRAGLRDSEERAAVLVPPQQSLSGLNLSKRAQALRMSRRGDDGPRIAAALGIPEREVDLLLKVQKIVLEQV
jgi:hypothetical protein